MGAALVRTCDGTAVTARMATLLRGVAAHAPRRAPKLDANAICLSAAAAAAAVWLVSWTDEVTLGVGASGGARQLKNMP
jgi:hypothetical protein